MILIITIALYNHKAYGTAGKKNTFSVAINENNFHLKIFFWIKKLLKSVWNPKKIYFFPVEPITKPKTFTWNFIEKIALEGIWDWFPFFIFFSIWSLKLDNWISWLYRVVFSKYILYLRTWFCLWDNFNKFQRKLFHNYTYSNTFIKMNLRD